MECKGPMQKLFYTGQNFVQKLLFFYFNLNGILFMLWILMLNSTFQHIELRCKMLA